MHLYPTDRIRKPQAGDARVSHVVEINAPEQLDEIRLLWNSLLPRTLGASFFHTIDWLETYWRHEGAGQKLRVMIVYSKSGPIGILPLCVRRERYKIGSLRILTYPLHDYANYYGPIGPNPTATLLGAMRHVHQTRRDWDLLDLRGVNTRSLDRGRTPRAMHQSGFRSSAQVWSESSALSLTGTWEEYLASRMRHCRENYHRSESRLADRGNIEFLRYRPEGLMQGQSDPRWDLYDMCDAIAQIAQQGSTANGATRLLEDAQPLLRDCHQVAAKLGMLDLNLLLVDQQPVAFAYNYHYEGNIFVLRVGSDPAYSEEGADSVMAMRAVADSFVRGDQHYHLGRCSLGNLREIATHLESSYRYTYIPKTAVRAQALRMKRIWRNWWPQRTAVGRQARTA